jgi:hypothetical protein
MRHRLAFVSILFLVAAAGCGGEPSAAQVDDDDAAGGASAGQGGAGVGGATGPGGGMSSGGGGILAQGDPPFGASSLGNGGPAPANGDTRQAGSVTYRLVAPSNPASPVPMLVVYSGTEGGQQMTSNMMQVAEYTGTDGFVRAVLDGVVYNGDGGAGALVIDDLRSLYDIDNDRMYLMGESAGTTAALQLGFELRQTYFAAYWANDVNASGTPNAPSTTLGFSPWGQVGPGGAQGLASQIVSGMQSAGYRLDNPSPYAGAGANQHGSPDQFIAAMFWFVGKTR